MPLARLSPTEFINSDTVMSDWTMEEQKCTDTYLNYCSKINHLMDKLILIEVLESLECL